MTSLSRIALLLSVAIAAPLQAATEAPALPPEAAPVEELTELAEVRVRGTVVANAVASAENRLFRLYNRLNKNNRYDIHCGDVRVNPNTLALQHVCLPEFLGYSLPATTFVGGYIPPPPFSPGFRDCLGTCFASDGFGFNNTSYGYTSSFGGTYLPTGGQVGIPTLSAQARAEFSEHLLGVIRSDPELLGLATDLAGMYREMDRVQGHFRKLQEERRAARAAKEAAARERAKERERERGYKLRPLHPRAT